LQMADGTARRALAGAQRNLRPWPPGFLFSPNRSCPHSTRRADAFPAGWRLGDGEQLHRSRVATWRGAHAAAMRCWIEFKFFGNVPRKHLATDETQMKTQIFPRLASIGVLAVSFLAHELLACENRNRKAYAWGATGQGRQDGVGRGCPQFLPRGLQPAGDEIKRATTSFFYHRRDRTSRSFGFGRVWAKEAYPDPTAEEGELVPAWIWNRFKPLKIPVSLETHQDRHHALRK